MTSSSEDISLMVDWDILDACKGFTFDMGGSVLKLVYIDKQDWVEPADRKPGSKGCLRMTNFSRQDLDEAIAFIKKRVRFNRKNDTESINIIATGFGGSLYSEHFKEKLNVINSNIDEMACFKEGFLYVIKNYPRGEIIHPVYKPAFEAVEQEIDYNLKLFGGMSGMVKAIDTYKTKDDITFPQLTPTNQDKPFADDEDFFPCGIMMCGSAFGFSWVNADGSTAVSQTSSRGGRMFIGLGTLLTRAKDYNELMDLCAKGDGNELSSTNLNIAQRIKIKSEAGDNDVYAKWLDSVKNVPENVIFSFGRVDGRNIEDFKREDLARCLLDTHCSDLVTIAHDAAALRGIKHVFFCGGFTNNALVREVVTRAWLRKDSVASIFDPLAVNGIQCHFLVHGQSLGALGALVNHKEWSKGTNTPSNKDTGKHVTQGYKQATGV